MIKRQDYLDKIKEMLEIFPIVAVLGARQVGKSTLAKTYIQNIQHPVHFYDLENEHDLALLKEAQLSLETREGLIIIDEIQRRPDLFPTLRYLVDNRPQKYLILGSASRDIIQQSSESLAGRIGYIELPPIQFYESNLSLESHLVQGGFPRALLSSSYKQSYIWRQAYIKTFLERDLREIGFNVPPDTMRRFWKVLAHYHGQIFNATEVASSMGITTKTAQRYLSMLQSSFMAFELKPWFQNLGKRQIKKSRIYISDIGIFNTLSGIQSIDDLMSNPKMGSAFEGFAISYLIHKNGFDMDDCYFWRTSNGAELDLFVTHEGKRLGFEFKFTSSPKITPSMRTALKDLNLDSLKVIIPKGHRYNLSHDIEVLPLMPTS